MFDCCSGARDVGEGAHKATNSVSDAEATTATTASAAATTESL